MQKVSIRLPKSVLELDTGAKVKIAEELIKALGFSSDIHNDDEDLWAKNPDSNIDELENMIYSELSEPMEGALDELIATLGLEPVEKSLRDTFGKFRPNPERYAYEVPASFENVVYIPVNRLDTPYQTERATDWDKVREIQRKLKSDAKLDPIVIGYDFDIHDGHHRWTASKEEGYTHVPCVVGGTDPDKVARALDFYRQMFKSIANDDWAMSFIPPSSYEDPESVSDMEASNKYMFRGIGDKELEFIQKNYFIRTKGKGNDSEQGKVMTLYSAALKKAEDYAISGLDLYNAKDGYVLWVKRHPEATINEVGELEVPEAVPESDIVRITKLNKEAYEAKDWESAFIDLEPMEKSLWNESKHPRDSDGKFTTKFGRAFQIGTHIEDMRKKYRKDLKLKGMPRDKAVALMIGLVDKGCFRMGNDESAEERGVYGLTTLTRDHIKVDGDTIHFEYIGKKQVHQKKQITDPDFARVMKELLKIEGGKKSGGKADADNAIFKFVNTQGEIRTPSQYVVNDYLSKWKVTVKDFRTYHASRLVFNYLKEMHKKGKTEEQRKADVKEAVEKAAEHLGHLPATCKRAYVDPRILELYMAGKFKANETLLEKALAAETINETAETSTYEFEDFERLFDAWGPDILEKSNPGFLEKLKKYFRKKYEYKPDGKTLNENQMDRIQAILEKYKIDPIKWAEGMAVRAYALGKLLGQRSDLAKVVVNSLPFKLETVKEPFVVRDTAGREFPMLPLQSQEQEAIKWSMENAASYIQTTNTSLIAGIRRLVTQAKMERWTANELSQALFDKFGEFNRDWRRIAITELSYAENNGYLSTLKPGDKLIINEAVDCCKHCKRLNVGKVFTLTDGPGEDPMTTVWVGKNNVGKKVADWRPAAPLHPNARCRYTRFNDTFYKMDESGKLVLRTAEEILQRDRQHS